MVHDCKLRVDGITKYLDNTDFAFDHAFDETETTEALYHYTAAPLVPFIFQVGSRGLVGSISIQFNARAPASRIPCSS